MKRICILAILCSAFCVGVASAQMFAELNAITAGGNVSAPGLAVVSSDYQSSVNGETVQAHVQSITSGGVQPMADTQGVGILTHADGYASVDYDFRVVGPSVDANGNVVRVPVIIEAIVHADSSDFATAQARFRWSNQAWATRFVRVEGNQSATRSLYARTSLLPGSGVRFAVDVRGIVSTLYGGGPTFRGEFQAIADPVISIDPSFADRANYSLVFSPGLVPPDAPACDIAPEGSVTTSPWQAIELTVTCTAPGSDEITLSSTNLPPDMNPDGEWPATGVSTVSRTFLWIPTPEDAGTHLPKFTASNAAGSTQRTRRVHVTEDPLTIDSFAPERGPAGTTVTIYGSNFRGVTEVLFNSVPVGQPFFTVVSDTEITAVVPVDGISGPIRVLTDTDDVRSADEFVIGSALSRPPITTAALSGPLGGGGWYVGPVTATLSATDPDGAADIAATLYSVDGGGVQTYSGPIPVTAEGERHITFWSVDRAGNEETPRPSVALRIDATPPALAWGAPSPAPNAAGWNNTPVDIPYTASDSLSGVAGEPVAGLRLAGEGANQNRTLTLADVAGNTATFLSPSVNIDSTPPLVAVAASPDSVWPRGKRAVSVQVSGSATDVLAGLNPSTAAFSVVDDAGTTLASGPVTLGADGSYAFTVTLAARKGSKSRQYRIAVAVSDLAGNAGTGAAIVEVSPGH